jgi:hypothetical protein
MRKTIALFVSLAFLLGTTGFAVAQTSAPAPAEKKADEKSMKSMDKSMEKKPASHKKMTMEEKKAACLEKAGTDEAKKAKCEKQFTAKNTQKKAAATGQTGEKKQ